MLIHSASQLLTIAGGPQRGPKLGNLEVIKDGAVLIERGVIVETGPSEDLLSKYPHQEQIDARGRVVMPGFVDPHTHVLWVGDRAREFELRTQGKSYLEVMEAGGGIVSTVKATRKASLADLKSQTRKRLQTMFAHGTTTIEAKTGYGLEMESELRSLQAYLELAEEVPQDLVITFLGAHAVPLEYAGDPEGYTALVCREMIPGIKKWWSKHTSRTLPFVDVFCEEGAFNLSQSRLILETAQRLGFPVKIHADEFKNLGGARLAAELGAVSADHLVVTSQKDIEALAGSDTVAVALPCTPFGLAEGDYTPAQEILSAGGLLAVATDLNPGTAWCESMQFAVALACRYMNLSPSQAIVSATINAAAAVGKESEVGSLEPGKKADIIILDVSDYRHLGYRFGTNLVHSVIKDGKYVPSEEFS
ncbi:MAG: imidazolonepropionase [Anaerolineales bacterium]